MKFYMKTAALCSLAYLGLLTYVLALFVTLAST